MGIRQYGKEDYLPGRCPYYFGQTHQHMATLRRDMHKQAVPFVYKQAMEKAEEDDALLYGEEFEKKLREAREACKDGRRPFLGKKVYIL